MNPRAWAALRIQIRTRQTQAIVAQRVMDHEGLERLFFVLTELPQYLEAQAECQDWLPEMIGTYQIKGQVGRGGMGVVLEAEQESPRRPS